MKQPKKKPAIDLNHIRQRLQVLTPDVAPEDEALERFNLAAHEPPTTRATPGEPHEYVKCIGLFPFRDGMKLVVQIWDRSEIPLHGSTAEDFYNLREIEKHLADAGLRWYIPTGPDAWRSTIRKLADDVTSGRFARGSWFRFQEAA